MNTETHTWTIVDNRQGHAAVSKTYTNRKRAQTRADKLNLEYGAHRYSARNNSTGYSF
jgi:hypothetical protein